MEQTIKIKVEKKSLFREIFESYRELPTYQYALLEIYCAIKGLYPVRDRCNYLSNPNDCSVLHWILDEIKILRAGLDKTTENAESSSDTA